MCSRPKTVFCDIDGTLIHHNGDVTQLSNSLELLPNVLESIREWERNNYRIILITGRKESLRKQTEEQLAHLGIIYDQLIMGLPNGDRILINDKKPNSGRNTAYSYNLVRNKGLTNLNIHNNNLNISVGTHIDKPWGYEELVEINDRYVVKKLFMKKDHQCSLQYHEQKTETIIILTGILNIYTSEGIDKQLTLKQYKPGDTITIQPYTIHRMEAVEDSLYIECSTNELWDVIRIQDSYGRV